jgi:hypothetical protein
MSLDMYHSFQIPNIDALGNIVVVLVPKGMPKLCASKVCQDFGSIAKVSRLRGQISPDVQLITTNRPNKKETEC